MPRFARQVAFVAGYQLQVIDCWNCGIVFGVPSDFDSAKHLDGLAFHCPNGHANYYSQSETAADREKKELKARVERAERDAAEQRRLREWSETRAKGANIAAGKAKAAARRLRERVEAGVCPDCHRTFKQLAAHMKCKHGIDAAKK